MFSASQARPSPGETGCVVHMAVECSMMSLRMARISSASAATASLILYSGSMSTIVDTMAAWGERLGGERRARGWPIERLAAASGVSRAMISKVERGESSPTAVVLGKLSAALELSVSELLTPGPGGPGEGRSGWQAADQGGTGTGSLGAPAPGGGTVRRDADTPQWRDPDTGYLRRQVSTPRFPAAV